MKMSVSRNYSLNETSNPFYTVVGTYKIDDAMLSYKIKGTLDHSDLSAEYEEDGKYKGLE